MGRTVLEAPSHDDTATRPFADGLRALALPVLVVVANVLVLYGFRVPHSNEYVYLLRLRSVHDPSFLAQDWTFTRSFNEHFLFNTIFSPLTGVASIEVIGWIGRLACWLVLAGLLLQFALDLGLRRWPATVALVAWLPCQLRLVGADWVFGTFEAKPLAYITLLSALLLALRRRVPWALVLAGLAFSLHPGVGIWGSVPLVAALAWWNATRRDTLRWCWIAVLAAAPGAISTLGGLGSTSAPREVWTFVVNHAHPYHLNPFYFGVANVALLAAMFAFNLAWARARPRPRGVDGLLTRLQVLMAMPVVGGIVIYGAGRDELLKYYPFRVFPVFVSILFFDNLADVWQRRRTAFRSGDVLRSIGTWAVVATFAVIVFWNPPRLYASEARLVYRDWSSRDSALDDSLRWVQQNVSQEAVVIMPPGPEDTFMLAERAQIANQKALSFDEIAEWYERVGRLAPGLSQLEDEDGVDEDDLAPLYASLDEDDVLALRDDYRARYIVSSANYSFPSLHRSGDWTVYELPAAD